MYNSWCGKDLNNIPYESSPNDLKALASLLQEGSDTSDDDDDLPNAGVRNMGPSDIKSKVKMRVRGNECLNDDTNKKNRKENDKDIWSLDEIDEIPSTDDILYDPRQKPEYEITYRQNVSTEDIYLQMGNKTPMTSSCELMTINVKLKDEMKENIDCNLSSTEVDIRTLKYRLNLPLPHPVDPDSSQATWDSAKETITITLRINRELDFINF